VVFVDRPLSRSAIFLSASLVATKDVYFGLGGFASLEHPT
jgi:hypothetical protein